MFVCLLGQPFSVSLCTINKIGSHCVSAPIFVRRLLVKAEMDMASNLRSSWICVSVCEGRWLRASARSISLPGLYIMVMSYWCSQRSISVAWLRLQWDFSCLSSPAVCGLFQLWMFFCTGKCGTSHSHTRWLGVLSQCWHIVVSVSLRDLLTKAMVGHLGWCNLKYLEWSVTLRVTGLFLCSTWGVSAMLSAVGI